MSEGPWEGLFWANSFSWEALVSEQWALGTQHGWRGDKPHLKVRVLSNSSEYGPFESCVCHRLQMSNAHGLQRSL